MYSLWKYHQNTCKELGFVCLFICFKSGILIFLPQASERKMKQEKELNFEQGWPDKFYVK